MQADWEVEIGPGAPIIEGQWPGFVDIRQHPNQARDLPEAAQFPALAGALIQLNAHGSPVWTSKCDLWPLTNPAGANLAAFDPDELDAPPAAALHALACYIDLLPRSDQQWTFPAMAVASCKYWCDRLQTIPLRCCRADFIVRRACVAPEEWTHAVTAYLSACGPTPACAQDVLGQALAIFAHALFVRSKLQ